MTGKNMSWFNFRIILIVYGWKIYIEIQNVITVSKYGSVQWLDFIRFLSLYDQVALHKPQHASKTNT